MNNSDIKNNIIEKLRHVKSFCVGHIDVALLALPFIMLDIITRIMGNDISFFPFYYPVPNIFTIVWCILFIGIVTSLKKPLGTILYWLLFAVSLVLYLTHNIYYSLTDFFFTTNLLELASEGSAYVLDTIMGAPVKIYILALITVVAAAFCFKKLPDNDKTDTKRLITTIILFLILHTLTPFLLGPANNNLKWNTFKNPRNVYMDFSDFNKSMKVAGLYEYTVRDFYVTFIKPEEKISDEEKEFLDKTYSRDNVHVENDYTGIFAGKNVIFLQLEGLDDWVLTKETTPNLYALKQQSIDFTDHYSIYTGGGSTFNSEFAVNTGFTTPVSFVANVYKYNTNLFPYTMPRLFKNLGYSVNAFHMNSKDFYSRGVNYKSWGYDNYYGLIDIKDYPDNDHYLDRELILNPDFYELMFNHENATGHSDPFVNYIITYSPHKPFNTAKDVAKKVAETYYGKDNVPDLDEEECVKLQVGETDYMVELLMQALKDNNLYDNTVIVAYADHYLYTIDDKSILDRHKNTENNLINHTPFFIWSSDVKPEKINKTSMQTDILPTVLNMFGIDYNSNDYIGHDLMSNETSGYAFFSDYSWYDGNVYYEDGKITNGAATDAEHINNMNQTISDVIKKNDLTLKSNYFKYIE